jgi:Transposase DDE domain group 1
MGERQNGPFQLSFNSSLKVDFQGSRVTSDGGLILVRELDERLGFGDLIAQHLTDSRRGRNTQLPLADLLRQSVYSRIGLRGCQRRRASLARSDLSPDRFGEDLGSWCGADFSLANVRDRDAGRGGKLRQFGPHQP